MSRISFTSRKALLALCLCWTAQSIQAKCVLPVPDGGDITPSPANVRGTVKEVKADVVVIEAFKTHKKVAVSVPQGEVIYTVFGGDNDRNELKPGQLASVWFVGCKATRKSLPQSAYFQIYSTDPNDRP